MIREAIRCGDSADWAGMSGRVEAVGEGDYAICVLPMRLASALVRGDASAIRELAGRVARQSVDVLDAVDLLEATAILRRAFPRVIKAGVRLGRGACRRGASRTRVDPSSARTTD